MIFFLDRPKKKRALAKTIPRTDNFGLPELSTSEEWAWASHLFKLQSRDLWGYLSIAATIWTLFVRIDDLKREPDRSATYGTMVLLVMLGGLALTEIGMVSRLWKQQKWPTTGWLSVPRRVVIALLILAMIVEVAFFDETSQIRAVLGATFLGLYTAAINKIYSRIKGRPGHDSTTTLAFILSGLILGCSMKMLWVGILYVIFALLIPTIEAFFVAVEAKRQKTNVIFSLGLAIPRLFSKTTLSIVPLMLATSILCLPVATKIIFKLRAPAEAAEKAAQATIRELQENQPTELQIDPGVRKQLQQYYGRNNARLRTTVLLTTDPNEEAMRDEFASFVFITKHDSKTDRYKVTRVYTRRCWCDF